MELMTRDSYSISDGTSFGGFFCRFSRCRNTGSDTPTRPARNQGARSPIFWRPPLQFASPRFAGASKRRPFIAPYRDLKRKFSPSSLLKSIEYSLAFRQLRERHIESRRQKR